MNSTEKLVKFIEMKNEIIENKTSIKYINEKDIAEVREWSQDKCKKTYERLKYNIFKMMAFDISVTTCPWCLINTKSYIKGCEDCGYGKRHVVCYNNNSLYHKYVYKCSRSLFSNAVYRNMIKRIEELR